MIQFTTVGYTVIGILTYIEQNDFFAPVSNYVGYFTIGVRGDCVLFGDISALVSFSAN